MLQAVDAKDIEEGPKKNVHVEMAYFFVVFIFIGNFFLMNFFIGVLFLNFENAQKSEKEALFLKDSQMKWVDMMKMIVKARPNLETTNVP